jgi:phospho-N-acetylmuramoyl-pentapeptide-transferase
MNEISILRVVLSVFLTSAVLSWIVTFGLVSRLKRFKAGQVIQEDAPERHQSKAGTPTMGGIGFLLCSIIVVLLFVCYGTGGKGCSIRFLYLLGIMLAYMLVGAVDDWLTIKPRGGVRGLSSKVKFFAQLVVAAVFVAGLAAAGEMDTSIAFWGVELELGWVYYVFALIFLTGMANFVNLTDGLDGLAAGLSAILFVVMSVYCMTFVKPEQSNIGIIYTLAALSGGCVAFLWHNCHPAKVFMGDTGSLALGIVVPAAAILLRIEVFVIIAGLVFVAEGLSSAVQWAVFKYTRIRTGTGRRVFKMSPLHHHFELCGYPEQAIVVRFWIAGIFCSAVALVLVALSKP